ncbi:MAG: flagellar hook-associated protein 3 FlgL [Planctomycetota bacterium]|jgi:flagellar hook-associated protein 3 FlgL
MVIRPTQSSIYSLVQRGLNSNLSKLAHAQERVATGKRILRPSDDALGTARSLGMRRRLGLLERFQESVSYTRPALETGTSALEDVSGILSEARSLIVTSMSGSMNPADRKVMSQQISLILERLVDVANTKVGDRYLFSGTSTDTEPYSLNFSDGLGVVDYHGNKSVQRIAVGFGTDVPVNIPGSEIFGSSAVESVDLSGLTGLKLGVTANEGTGFSNVTFRHDATTGTPGSGISLASGGLNDTILNDHTLTVDSVTNTVQLDGGEPVSIPGSGDSDFANFALVNDKGAKVHLDFTGYSGASSTSTLSGEGSVSMDGSSFIPIDYTETDLQLISDDGETILHFDTTEVHRAGDELVSFSGATDIFNVLAGVAQDLKNSDGLSSIEVVDRVLLRYDELQRGFGSTLNALGTLGSLTERLNTSDERLESTSVNLQGLLSQVEDVDVTAVILEMNQAEQTLQLAQATGSRIISHTLLDFLR